MKNLFYTLFIVGFIVSCGTENNPTYQLTTTVSPTEGGTITLSPSGGVYSEDEVVTMTGTPSNGWRFVRWEGDWSGESNPSTITMNKNYSVVGVFEKRNYPLTITIEGEGTVEERVVQQKTTEYPFQTVVELTPIPKEGWRFVEWGGDLSGSEVPKMITVDGNKTVMVKFERKNYPLTITIIGEGTVTETIIPQRTTQYPYQTLVQLIPVPSEGWEFVSWGGDLSGNENPTQITVDTDKQVTVTFQLKTYPLNVSVVGNGTIGIEPQQEVYTHGSTVRLTPIPSNGWEFLEWGGDLSGTTVPLVVTVTSELNIVGTFQRKNYPLTITIIGEGTVTETIIPQRTTQYPYQTLVQLIPVPSNGWEFLEWGGDLSGNENPQMIVVDGDKSVTVRFEKLVPPTVTTGSVSSVTISSATVAGNVTSQGSSSVTARGVVWSTTQNPTVTSNTGMTNDGTGTGSFTSTLTGLSAETQYYVQVYATNEVGTTYGEQREFTTTDGRDNTTTVVDVTNQATGRIWMDRNLGASRAATSSTDAQAYGDLYQWGRRADGHQKRNSSTTTTLSNTDVPTHGSFILAPSNPIDWRSPQNNNLWQGVNGVNNPCPVGYRIPTEAEWTAERQSWSSNNSSGAINSPLKLPLAGTRSSSDGSLNDVGSYGLYWSSSVSGSDAQNLYFFSSFAGVSSNDRAFGLSVRCLKD